VANKITSEEDITFVKASLPDQNILSFIPYSTTIKANDRDGLSVLDVLDKEIIAKYEEIYTKLEIRN
jgi:hypothetical protein